MYIFPHIYLFCWHQECEHGMDYCSINLAYNYKKSNLVHFMFLDLTCSVNVIKRKHRSSRLIIFVKYGCSNIFLAHMYNPIDFLSHITRIFYDNIYFTMLSKYILEDSQVLSDCSQLTPQIFSNSTNFSRKSYYIQWL